MRKVYITIQTTEWRIFYFLLSLCNPDALTLLRARRSPWSLNWVMGKGLTGNAHMMLTLLILILQRTLSASVGRKKGIPFSPTPDYSHVPIRRHGTFIRHTPFIRPNTFPKKWAVSFNWISMSKWSTFRYKFVSINLHLLYRPRHMWLIFRPIHFSSCVPLHLFRTPLLIGTRE